MHSNLVIKQQKSKPWYIGVGFLFALFLTVSFLLGRSFAQQDLNETRQKLMLAEAQLEITQGALENASENLVMQKQSAQIDTLSNQELVNSVKTMQQSNNELVSELSFYRKIMAPELEQEGLEIDSLRVNMTDLSNKYHFQTTLIQAGKQSQFLKGELTIKLVGELDGEAKEYDIRELGTFNKKYFQFQFKYFQNIQGFIEIPAGFTVRSVSMVAQTKGLRKNQRANKQITWQPQESQNYVR